ncbi:high nitrogen upregulated cytochrome P450 monooxygenase 2 [Mycena vulgaris]|nr:high nitrogen upregulated cytochrome P450 monooxygenase 2 [Mycena vulgaris]
MLESIFSEINIIPLVILLGLINHAYFHRFEPMSANGPIIVLAVQPLLLLFTFSAPISFWCILATYTVFLVSLCSSIIVYRISPWHPLSHIPGPTVNKITKLWGAWISSGGDQHRVNKALHDKYGPFLRTGPNEISVIHVDAVKAVLGAGGFPKGQCEAHANRRRIWNRGMSSDSLSEYESILAKRVAQLVARLAGLSGSVDISEWLSYFTFDFMGDMAFGGGFEMLRDGVDKDGFWTIIGKGAKNISIVSHIPWSVPTLNNIPPATRGIRQLRKFGVTCATNRIRTGAQVKDLWYHLTDEAGIEKDKPTFAEVVADGVLSIIAGSDTTSTALSCLVWFLLSNPEVYRRVQAEVDSVYPDDESLLDATKHSELRFLTACLNETLRLHPPLPTNGTRQVPSGGGKVIAGRFIPEGTQIYVPAYSLHRSPLHFSPAPDRFDPDRWLRQHEPGEVLNQAAFIPFSYGAANCVGKSLAWREMLMVASTLVKKFNLRFADGFQGENWLDNLQDFFVTNIGGPLLVVISRR